MIKMKMRVMAVFLVVMLLLPILRTPIYAPKPEIQNGANIGREISRMITAMTSHQVAPRQNMLGANEILDVGGYIGGQIKKTIDNYAFDPKAFPLETYIQNMEKRDVSDWSQIGALTGQWVETVSAAKWYIKENPAYTKKLNEIISRMAAAQVPAGVMRGYLGVGAPATVEESASNRPMRGTDAYEMYSTLHGLLEKYESDGDETALQTAKNLGDYFVRRIGPSEDSVPDELFLKKYEFKAFAGDADWQKKTIAGDRTQEGWEGALLIDPVMRLYQATGEESYLSWVVWVLQSIDSWSRSTPYADLDAVYEKTKGVDELQEKVHADTFQKTFAGMIRLFEETGNESFLQKVQGAYSDVADRQRAITGAVGADGLYKSGRMAATARAGDMNTSGSWMRLCQELLAATGDPEYADAMERVLYNHALASQTADGDGFAAAPPNGTTAGYFTGSGADSAGGMQLLSMLPYFLYGKSDDSVFVNQYVPSEVNITLKNGHTMHLTQTTDYPAEESIQLKIQGDGSGYVPVYLRIPTWAAGAEIKVNGVRENGVTAGEYMALTRVWSPDGDVVEITFPLEMKWVEGKDGGQVVWAVQRGPVVYAPHTAFMTPIEEEETLKKGALDKIFYRPDGAGEKTGAARVNAAEQNARVPDGLLAPLYSLPVGTVDESGQSVVSTMVLAPYANAGRWYRGTSRPTDFAAAPRYTYKIWLPSDLPAPSAEPERSIRSLEMVEDAVLHVGHVLTLPGKLRADYDDGTNALVPVLWNMAGVDRFEPGCYIAAGHVAGWPNPLMVTVNVLTQSEDGIYTVTADGRTGRVTLTGIVPHLGDESVALLCMTPEFDGAFDEWEEQKETVACQMESVSLSKGKIQVTFPVKNPQTGEYYLYFGHKADSAEPILIRFAFTGITEELDWSVYEMALDAIEQVTQQEARFAPDAVEAFQVAVKKIKPLDREDSTLTQTDINETAGEYLTAVRLLLENAG